jgi:hypothetical protein
MASGTLAPSPYLTVLDGNGSPVPGARIYTYAAGTTTPIATYTDAALSVANHNPIIADAAGRYTAYLIPGTGYLFDIQSSTGSSIDTVDNILGVPSSASTIDIAGTAGVAITSGQTVYLSTGTGGAPTAGKWYLADATNTYSSTLPIVGVAVDSIALNGTGTIRLAGAVSNPSVLGGSSLTVGNTYYVSTTPGSITTTAPANSKVVGLAQSSTSLVVSYQSPIALPLTVVNGGTGQSTLTSAYGVLAAGTSATGAVQTVVPGTANKLLVSGGTAALPSWSWYSNPAEYDNGNSGASKTLDFAANGPVQKVTRTANTTLTLTAPAIPAMVVIKLVHEASTTAYTVAYSPTPKWPGGVAPTYTNTSGAVDILTLYWDGVTWYGSFQANFA